MQFNTAGMYSNFIQLDMITFEHYNHMILSKKLSIRHDDNHPFFSFLWPFFVTLYFLLGQLQSLGLQLQFARLA